jgi:hypothetical protein
MKIAKIAVLCLLVTVIAGAASFYRVSASSVTPVFVLDNPVCSDLGSGWKEMKIESSDYSGTYPIDSLNNLILSVTDTKTSGEALAFNWDSSLSIDAVIVKAGDGANVYYYNPEASSDNSVGTIGKKAISHISFCYDYELQVSKTAATSFVREFSWDILKSVNPASWTLFKGDTGESEYTVAVTKKGYTDKNWQVSGAINISNNTPFNAEINSVKDVMNNTVTTLDCAVTYPYTLSSGQSLVCSYSINHDNGSNGVNYAYVETTGTVLGGMASADVVFSNPSSVVNDSVTVDDSVSGNLGAFSSSQTIKYKKVFSCDSGLTWENNHASYSVNNTATISETGQMSSASVSVDCYSLQVSKTAKLFYDKVYDWKVLKSSSESSITLKEGESKELTYEVKAEVTGERTENVKLVGIVKVYNPNPIFGATIARVDDIVSGGSAVTLNCGASFPYMLAPGQELSCGYEIPLASLYSVKNTAKAGLRNYSIDSSLNATPSGMTGFFGTAVALIEDAVENKIDESVLVSDSMQGNLGVVNFGEAPKTFSYSVLAGPYSPCGNYEINNTATVTTNDSGKTNSADNKVLVTTLCPPTPTPTPTSTPTPTPTPTPTKTPTPTPTPTFTPTPTPIPGSCNLTVGYWKTHSEYGPASYDPTWGKLPNGADTLFAGTGKTWYQVFQTPVETNAYYILAHQDMASYLNTLKGSPVPANVQTALDRAWYLLNQYDGSPYSMSLIKGTVRAEFVSLAKTLDMYNNGLIETEHCN